MSTLAELDAFIDESIRRSRDVHYLPTRFMEMRRDLTTKGAMEKLVLSGDLQKGFLKMQKMNMLEWTVETAVLKFPELFTKDVKAAAAWRLEQARKK